MKHIGIEGPDSLDVFFKKQGFATKTIELQDGDLLPERLDGIDAVIVLGGPMNVYEEDTFPFFVNENRFIRDIAEANIPFMGICLGSQLLAKACGAKVGRSPEKEIGMKPVTLTGGGKADPLFAGLQEKLNVFHWHEDMAQLPSGAVLLASSEGCPHQAFRVGRCAYGLQFHIEVTEPTVHQWIRAYFKEDKIKKGQLVADQYRKQYDAFHALAEKICQNFLNIIQSNKQMRTRN